MYNKRYAVKHCIQAGGINKSFDLFSLGFSKALSGTTSYSEESTRMIGTTGL